MIIKTNNLTGVDLNWAVSTCEGIDQDTAILNITCGDDNGWFLDFIGDWAQGGPIIERHRIEICHLDNGEWRAQLNANQWGVHCRHYGESPLIAAMRCYVASKLGDDVEIPEALCNQ